MQQQNLLPTTQIAEYSQALYQQIEEQNDAIVEGNDYSADKYDNCNMTQQNQQMIKNQGKESQLQKHQQQFQQEKQKISIFSKLRESNLHFDAATIPKITHQATGKSKHKSNFRKILIPKDYNTKQILNMLKSERNNILKGLDGVTNSLQDGILYTVNTFLKKIKRQRMFVHRALFIIFSPSLVKDQIMNSYIQYFLYFLIQTYKDVIRMKRIQLIQKDGKFFEFKKDQDKRQTDMDDVEQFLNSFIKQNSSPHLVQIKYKFQLIQSLDQEIHQINFSIKDEFMKSEPPGQNNIFDFYINIVEQAH